jgi:predicted nucleic acid-binding protein
VIIVSDSGPLAYLVLIGVADSLPSLYGDVYIPPAVLTELRHPNCPVVLWAKQLPAWLHVAEPISTTNETSLDVGEREAIALAIELGAERVLMDEKQGRRAAQAAGLQVAGTLAVIVDGALSGLFDGVVAIDRLAGTNFYASSELIENVRELLRTPRPNS